jgi:FixJ family two-component response regulator
MNATDTFSTAASPSVGDARSTVFVIDDDISVRESLELLIRHEGFNVESFVCAKSFLTHPHVAAPACLILDIALPGVTGLELQKSLVSDRPEMPIIFITGREDVPTTVQAMKAGAVEFLLKPFSDDVLVGAVRLAIERSKALVAQRALRTTSKERYARLTRRERQVFSLITSGLLNREVGEQLGISEITVKAHRGQVMRKMEADSLADLIRMAANLDIL